MRTLIKNASIYLSDGKHTGCSILIEGTHISKLLRDDPGNLNADTIIDAENRSVIPGMIDIHVHGAMRSDTMDTAPDTLDTMSRFFASRGVTSFLPTTVAASNADINMAIEHVRDFKRPNDGAKILGIHLEGPYLDFEYKGAQPEQHLRPAHPNEYLPWLETGLVKIMTVAPEIYGVMALIEAGVSFGVRFAVGHSKANYAQMNSAIERGLTQATHLFNGMPSIHHRAPGIVGAVLTDKRVYAQVIADGIHVHPAVVDLIFKAKGVDRTVLITDGISATGVEDGQYQLGDQVVQVENGIARTASDSLAGSTLRMDQALINALKFTKYKFEEVLRSATSVAAESIGMEDLIGRIEPGYQADLVIMNDSLRPVMTIVDGSVVFDRSAEDA